jgi:iron complex outermembrane receptor protein
MPTKQFRKRSLLFSLFSFFVFAAYSQTIVITGRITDDKSNPVPGATVSAKGSAASTTADQNGEFRLSINARVKALIISSVGYVQQEVSIDGRTEVDVTMIVDSKSMNDVVVIGYGSVRRKDVTGAVANVTSKDFNPGVISNPMQQIQGKVAGLVITQPGGDPNGNLIIRLRGQTSLSGGQAPLVVVDGIPLDDINQISSIPPGDIASFDVLKDVSATAIYGSRGANGVIIINTKRGSAGKAKVEYNGYAGVNWLSKKLDLLTADEWRAAVKNIPGIDQSTIDGLDKGANTDWQDAVTRNAFTHSHNLAVSGGTGGFNYRASLNYTNQDGIVINTGKEQLGLRFNAQQKALNDKLVINVSLSSNQNNRKYTDYNIFDYVNTTPPTYPVYNADGSYFAYYDFDQQNPVSQQMLETNTGKEYLTQLYGRVDYEIINGLKLGVLGSTSHYNLHSEYFQPVLPGVGNINNASQTSADKDSKKGDIHINYLRDFGKHNVNATAVYEYNDFTNGNFSAKGQNYLISQELDNNLGGGNPALNSIGSYKESFKIISFLARVAYNYNSKYYATVSLRRDGSSKFGANNRWANFPSASVAWRISQESFLKDITWINELKINAGFGSVGNQDAISPYNTLLTLGGAGRFFDPTTSTYQYP